MKDTEDCSVEKMQTTIKGGFVKKGMNGEKIE
jgi:hypothetical protein